MEKSEIRRIVEGRISPHTRKQYGYCLARIGREIDTDEGLCEYIEEKFREGKAPGSIQNILNAVRWDCERNGKPSPVGPLTRARIKAMRREGRNRGRGQAKGVQWQQAAEVAAMAERDTSLVGLRDAAMIAVQSDGLLRVSEVAKIRVEDVQFGEDGTATLRIPYSKTDQDGRDCPELFLGYPTASRIRAWLGASGIQEGPLFRRVHIGAKRTGTRIADGEMSTEGVRGILKRRCKAAGIEGISGHSFRVGSAQSLAVMGASLIEMQQAGRWTSPEMPYHYSKKQLAAKGAVARLRYGQQ